MENHIIICGFGRNGKQAVSELILHNHPCVVLENNHQVVQANTSRNFRFIEGDATDEELLKTAGIETALALVTTLPNDADNLFIVMTARTLNPGLLIVSRAENESVEKKLKLAGASNVVMPERVGGAFMAKLIAQPDVVEFLEHLSVSGQDPTNLVEIACDKLSPDCRNKTICDIGIRKKTGVNIIGFKTPEGEFLINPSPETVVTPGSKLFVLGTREQVFLMQKILNECV